MVAVAAGSVFLMLGVAVKLKPPRLDLEAGVAAELTAVETKAGVRPWPNLKQPLGFVPGAAPVPALGVTDTAADGPSMKPPLGVVPGATPVPEIGVTDTAADGPSLKPPLGVVPGATPVPEIGVTDTAADGPSLKPGGLT